MTVPLKGSWLADLSQQIWAFELDARPLVLCAEQLALLHRLDPSNSSTEHVCSCEE